MHSAASPTPRRLVNTVRRPGGLLAILAVAATLHAQPTLSPIFTSNVGPNQVTLTLQSTANGKGYFTFLEGAGAPAGNSFQTKDGKDGNDSLAAHSGSLSLTTNVAGTYTVRNLKAATTYKICFTAEDGVAPAPAAPVTTTLTTAAAGSFTHTWTTVGSAGFSAGQASYLSFDFAADGTPYVAYSDGANGSKATVMSYSGGSWNTVGSAGFSGGQASYVSLALAPDGTPWVGFRNTTLDFMDGWGSVWRFSGGAWNEPSDVTYPTEEPANYVVLAFSPNGRPNIAFQSDASGDEAAIRRFDGTFWQYQAQGLSGGAASHLSLVFAPDGSAYLAYRDRRNSDMATVLRSTNYTSGIDSTWNAVGTAGFSAGAADYVRLAIAPDGTPYVAYMDASVGDKVTVMKYSGGSWSAVGSTGFSSGTAVNVSLAIASDGTPWVAYTDSDNGYKATVMSYSDGSWSVVGGGAISAGNAFHLNLAFAPDGTPHLAYQDVANANRATVMKLLANTLPSFVGATTTLAVNANASATDVKSLLHVSDADSGQTLTWTQSAAPAHGTLSFSSATASSGNTDVTPGGTITYAPAADYSGSDSFTVQVSDGFATATRTLSVTVNATVPGAPTIGTATAGNTQASVAFTAPASNGGAAITGYTVTSSPGSLTGTGASSPITVTGLTNGQTYTFTVTATNSAGTGAASAASNSVTPSGPPTVDSPTSAGLTATGATLGGTITADGGSALTERGIVYAVTATNANPQIGGTGVTQLAASGTSTGVFTVDVTELTSVTGYSFKAYATNANGTSYSSAGTFTTSASSDANLSALDLSGGTLSPVFAGSTTSYTATVSYGTASLTVIPTVVDSTATVKVNNVSVTSGEESGAITLNVGTNTITTVVTAQDGTTTKTYTVTVSRSAAVAGDVDPDFDPDVNSYVFSVALQPDGKILLGGIFTSVASTARDRLVRLNPDGSLDAGFDPGADNTVYNLVVQPDGKILAAGYFTTLGGSTRHRLARLNADGSLDTGFDPDASDAVLSLALQSDGKILVGGDFTTIGATVRNHLARLNADGSVDTGFNPNLDGSVSALAVQSDGRIIVGGDFTTVGATARQRLARLNADGSLDTGFDPGADNAVYSAVVQADGKILLGGAFTTLGGSSRNRIARLNTDASLDTSFNPNAGGAVYSLALQADGKILASGSFSTVGSVDRGFIARLNTDGSLDTSFNPDANNATYGLALQPDGRVLAAGAFSTLGSTAHRYFARLINGSATQTLSASSPSRVQWLRSGTTPELSAVTFELSTDGGSTWSSLGVGTRISGGWELTGLTLPTSGSLRARGRAAGGYQSTSSGLIQQVQTFSGLVTAPTITSTLTASATYDSGFSYTITATNSPTSYAATGLPSGLSVNTSTGAITGAPSQTGTFNVALTATNAGGTSPAATLILTVNSAGASVILGSLTQTYTGSPLAPAVTTSPGGLAVSLTFNGSATRPTNAGTYTVVASVDDSNYSGSASGTFTIAKAAATIALGSLSHTYDGAAKAATATTTPAGLAVTFTYDGSATAPSAAGTHAVVATIASPNYTGSATGTLTIAPAVVAPTVVSAGATLQLTASGATSGQPGQWERNGALVSNGTTPTLTLPDVQPSAAGLYTYTATSPGGSAAASEPVIVGLSTTDKVIGTGAQVGADIVHPNGNVYDQVLLEGRAASVTADKSQVTRVSFVDLTNDIVQVEFSGAGTLSVIMDDAGSPTPAANYNQPGVDYVRGHAGLVITGANETSNLTVFSVGPVTAVNQSLFKAGVTYDGVADLAFVAIQSSNGKFGGVRVGNVHFYASRGFTGVYAPGVIFAGPVNLGNLTAFDSAQPVLVLGSAATVNITGGDLFQDNGQPVQVRGFEQLAFVDGGTSQGTVLPAQANRAKLVRDGVDVTALLVHP